MHIENKLKALGIELPPVAKPVAAYIQALQIGDMIYTSGQIPMQGGELKYRGKVGKELSVQAGQEAARLCVINSLAAVKSLVGDLDRIERIVKLNGFVNAVPDFSDHSQVINGASDFLKQLFGEAGEHTRVALGMSGLPLDAAVEIEITYKLAAR